MSQQAATSSSSHRPSGYHAAAVCLIRDRTRDAILASFPNANVPAPPALPYDHMAEWEQQIEVGAIAEYEAAQIALSLGLSQNGPSVRPLPTSQPVQNSSESQRHSPSTRDNAAPTPPQSTASMPAGQIPPGTPTIRTSPPLLKFPPSPAPSVLTTSSTPPSSIQNVAFISSGHDRERGGRPFEIRNVLESPSCSTSTLSIPTPPATPSSPSQSIRQIYFTDHGVEVGFGPGGPLGLGIHYVPETPPVSIYAVSEAASPGDTGKTSRWSQAFSKMRSSLRSLHGPEKGFTVERRQS